MKPKSGKIIVMEDNSETKEGSEKSMVGIISKCLTNANAKCKIIQFPEYLK